MSNSESEESGGDGAFVESGFDDDTPEKGVDEEYDVPNRSTPSPDDVPAADDAEPDTSEEPSPESDSPTASEDTAEPRPEPEPLPPNTTSIDWQELLGNGTGLAEHALRMAVSVEDEPLDVAPPTSRPLSSAGGTPPNSDGVNFRLTPTAQQRVKDLQHLADSAFEEDPGKSYVRDAIVRVAARHPDEVVGMLAAYGFDQPFE